MPKAPRFESWCYQRKTNCLLLIGNRFPTNMYIATGRGKPISGGCEEGNMLVHHKDGLSSLCFDCSTVAQSVCEPVIGVWMPKKSGFETCSHKPTTACLNSIQNNHPIPQNYQN